MRFPDLRLIGADGEQVGIVQSRKALQMAEDAGLDLVLVAPNARPPVCRIIDHGKFKYTQGKRQKLNKAKSKTQDVKGIKLRPSTKGQDIEIRLKRAIKFLGEGHKVRFVVRFRSREMSHPEIARARLEWFLEQLSGMFQVEKPATIEGRMMTMVISPSKQAVRESSKDGKVEDKQISGEAV